MFTCAVCEGDKKLKRLSGCVRPVSKRMCKKYHGTDALWYTDECFICRGEDPRCKFCRGSNALPVFRCPRALAKEVQTLLPYFFDWKHSNRIMWPDGRARLFQPVKLTQAFDMLDEYVTRYDNERQPSGS